MVFSNIPTLVQQPVQMAITVIYHQENVLPVKQDVKNAPIQVSVLCVMTPINHQFQVEPAHAEPIILILKTLPVSPHHSSASHVQSLITSSKILGKNIKIILILYI
jgi:hypothetical protein